ncbi:MAG TPA: peptide ABC transporter substrate-binding protein, partial [Oscillospiraceae bacterium]|nr:peptide ABC transporter substrate-binding protein [Oscillospiraceae bacterium]
RSGLKWSDGTELNAKDFAYSWTRATADETASDYAYMYDSGNIESWEASEDGTTFTVHLTSPCAYFYDLCAFPTFFAVQQACVEGAEGAAENPGAWATEAGFVCSGPYMLTSWDHNVSMVYEKNPNYWDADNVKLERIEFMLSDDDTAILAAYNAGDLDFIDTVPTDEIKNLLDNPEFYIADQLGTYYVCFNVESELFTGKTVEQANAMRRAFALLIDRQYIIDTVGQTGQEIATSFIPAKMSDGHGGEFKVNDSDYTYPDEESVGYFPATPDVDEAISLLESAGYTFTDGKLDASTPISFEYLTNTTTGHVAIAECIQQDLAAVGIDMTIRSIDWSVFLDERKQGNFDVARNGWIADFNDPINMLEMWTTTSGNNDAQFGRFDQ